MGNCINHETTRSWDEKEDWLWEDRNNNKNTTGKIVAKGPSLAANSGEVKIKVTKKQFEELLIQLDDENKINLLVHLLSDANSSDTQWRPSLQSIAEGIEI
ncbi:hypothetical protein ZOSMA_209G00150 [Zostera marina]|uniref:Uncharacterized protein n=1 Tax=Zostera marina TaxID=29655 RepID=A0A0K9PN94_ZOSMR|nr:hypothetical protein ZOSMA_209G00150 [Zostera marina]